jgi:glycosyltransferase involved in cell wall biosynthesis
MRQSAEEPGASPDGAAPKVSVVVPTFNRAGLLKETVDSILAQTYADFELIIVDNMSVDSTEAYVAGLADPRVRYFRNPNGGIIAVNRNYGIRQARGEYVALCDDDDLWLPEKLERQVPVLDRAPDVGLCYTNASTFDTNGEIANWMMKKVFEGHYQSLLVGNMIPNSTVLVRRILLEAFGNFDVRPEFVAVEDYSMWLRISRQQRLHYVDESLIRYRVHAAANSRNLAVMAQKTFRICLAEFRYNRLSSYHFYALCRSFVRMAAQRLLS